MGFGALRKIVGAVVNRIKYGKQIGKVSQAGYKCYGKTGKAGSQVYTLFDKNGKLVSKKKVFNDAEQSFVNGYSFKNVHTYDAQGNQIAYSSQSKEKVGFGLSSKNKFSNKIINHREKYNKMGQTIDSRTIEFEPSTTKQKATVFSTINGVQSKTYINTKTGQKHTITCLEK